jgi:hypothetical protein
VDQDHPRHEKIRFRRGEIADLGSLPSACDLPVMDRSSARRLARGLGRLLVGLAALVLLLAVTISTINWLGFGSERLRAEAERAVEELAGVDVAVAVGPARITLDGASFLALQVDGVSLKAANGQPMLDAGSIRFGVRLFPLLGGKISLSSARISDARLVLAALPSAGDNDWAAGLRNGDGLIDPDKVIGAAFAAVHQALDEVRLDSLREIRLANVELMLPKTGLVKLVGITKARAVQAGQGQMRFTAQADIDGRALTVDASATRDTATHLVTALDVQVGMGEAAGAAASAGGSKLGTLELHLTGNEGGDGKPRQLVAALSLKGSVLDSGRHGLLPADIDLDATLAAGTNKLSIGRLQMKTGRSTFLFAGSVGPKPATGVAGEEPSYRYDLVSDGSVLAPLESPEPAMPFVARIAGTYSTTTRKLVADTIAVRSAGNGEVRGSALVDFVEGEVPGLMLALNVHDMPVSHVKQLWPWLSAANARRWVLNNLFGGHVTDATLQFHVAPGRLGDGEKLTAEEVSGRFQVEGSRFDTAGRIPPVRDANGVVEFHGDDVVISLSSGTVYMPSGRTVAASNGTLNIMQADHPPVIGRLDIDVAGEAPAIVELSSYEPINAMRHVGLLPADISGTVTGNVKADIPLQSGADTKDLGWLVALDYTGLALAKPFDGQMVSSADGSITVDPQKAVIDADALLNGIPAEIDMIEPLEPEGPPRSRKVVLELDDKTRETFMPGLSVLLDGTVKVVLDRNDDGSQAVEADLTSARLNIPWAGWSKGPGIPASVAFTMASTDKTTTLSDFALDGKTFAIDGSVALSDGSLSSARFTRVALNRGDDVAVSVKRSAKGYTVSISGEALDARSLIKQFMSDADTATKSVGSDSVSVSADVGSLTGFHDEKLSNLKLDYSASGSRITGLKVSAVAGSGGAITVSRTAGGGQRALDMKSADAGAILRFLDIYEHMRGGAISLTLASDAAGPMRGKVVASDFLVVDEPKLASIVSTTPAGDNRSLNQAVRGKIDTSQVKFERGYAEIDKGSGYLKLSNGVLRGPLIGTTFQGTLYDRNDHMDMTGTFMPAYGLNRIFGELPIIGALLGNGRDRGLIGVTYRLRGDASQPVLTINPLSVIAPGIFRSIFEFR